MAKGNNREAKTLSEAEQRRLDRFEKLAENMQR